MNYDECSVVYTFCPTLCCSRISLTLLVIMLVSSSLVKAAISYKLGVPDEIKIVFYSFKYIFCLCTCGTWWESRWSDAQHFPMSSQGIHQVGSGWTRLREVGIRSKPEGCWQQWVVKWGSYEVLWYFVDRSVGRQTWTQNVLE